MTFDKLLIEDDLRKWNARAEWGRRVAWEITGRHSLYIRLRRSLPSYFSSPSDRPRVWREHVPGECARAQEKDVAGVIGMLRAYMLTYSNTYSCAECSHSHLQELVLSPNPRHYQVRPFIFAVTSILFSHLRRTCVSATAARSFPAVIRNPTRPPRVARQLCCCQTSITVP